MAELPLILVEQMFIFEEMTTVPYSLAKQQPGASCAQREEAALLKTKRYADGLPSTGRAVQLKAGEVTDCLRIKGSSYQPEKAGRQVHGPYRAVTRCCVII